MLFKTNLTFSEAKTADDLFSIAVYARDRVNPYMFIYAFSVALLHRKDTRGLKIPNNIQAFPDKFFDSQVFVKVREQLKVVPQGSRVG